MKFQILNLIFLSTLLYSCASDSVPGWDKPEEKTSSASEEFIPKPINTVDNGYIGFRLNSFGSSHLNSDPKAITFELFSEDPEGLFGLASDFGVWFSTRVNGELKTSVTSFYGSEFLPGKNLNYTGSDSLVFKIDSKSDINDRSFAEWPKEFGAPFNAVTGSPILFGDEMAWTIYNDLDSTAHNKFGDKTSLGLAVRQTAWVDDFNENNPALNRIVFHRFQVENLTSTSYDTLRMGFWIDPDLGNSSNDKIAFDTQTDLAFAYDSLSTNVNEVQGLYHFLGFALLSDTESDTNLFAFPHADIEELGNSPNAQNVENLLKGLTKDGDEIIHAKQGNATKFIFDGNVLTYSGWVDDETDKIARMLCVVKPFSLNPGEIKEVIAMTTISVSTDYGVAFNFINTSLEEARKKGQFWKNYQ